MPSEVVDSVNRLVVDSDGIRAVAFDCYGTLIDFTDVAFKQTLPRDLRPAVARLRRHRPLGEVDGDLAAHGAQGRARENPRNWPKRRSWPLSGDDADLPTLREEWPEHFEMCFQRAGRRRRPGVSAYDHVRNRLADAAAFDETAPVLAALKARYRLGILSNADDDFLFPCLEKNGLEFELIVTSERGGRSTSRTRRSSSRSPRRLGSATHEVSTSATASSPTCWAPRTPACASPG